MLCGGTSGAQVDDKIKTLVSQVKSEVEQQTNETYATFEPVEAMKQVVRSYLITPFSSWLGRWNELLREGWCW